MQRYTNFTITEAGLLIQLTEAGKEYARETIKTLKETEGLNEAFPGMPREIWGELNEWQFCNGYWDIPAHLKGLTEAPMISDSIITDETTQLEYDYANVWAFTDYMVRDELQELMEQGEVLFPLVNKYKDFPETPEDIEQEYVVSFANQTKMPLDGQADYNRCREALFNRINRTEEEDKDIQTIYNEAEAEIERLNEKILDMEQVITELNSQIKVAQSKNTDEQEDPPIGILDIPLLVNPTDNQANIVTHGTPLAGPTCTVPQSLINKLYQNDLCSYEDKSVNLKEHLFGLSLFDDCQENRIILNKEESNSLSDIYDQMAEKDCSYFRFIS